MRPAPVVDVRAMHLHVTRRSKSRFAMMHRSAVWPHWRAASEQPCQTLFDVAPSINDGKYRDRAVSRDIESKVVRCLCPPEHTPIRKRRQNPVPQRKPFKPAYCFQKSAALSLLQQLESQALWKCMSGSPADPQMHLERSRRHMQTQQLPIGEQTACWLPLREVYLCPRRSPPGWTVSSRGAQRRPLRLHRQHAELQQGLP